jgi:ligand-binding sensor domain-containing protein
MSSKVFFKDFIRKFPRKKIILLSISIVVLLLFTLAYFYFQKINLVLKDEANKDLDLSKIESSTRILSPIKSIGVKLSLETFQTRAMCEYKGNYYVATAGGLLELDKEGKLLNHYTILDGLPSINLLSLSVFNSQLYIGTADSGLVGFNGKDFTHYKIEKPEIKQINSLLQSGEKLFVGSFDGGLLSFDGTKFTRQDQNKKPIKQITSLLEHENRLFVGTYSSGLEILQEGSWLQLTKEQRLPSNHVTALIADRRGTIIATDFGVVLRTTNGEIEQVSTKANIVSLVSFQDKLFGGLLTGGVVELSEFSEKTNESSLSVKGELIEKESQWDKRTNTILWVDKDAMFALTNKGVLKHQESSRGLDFEQFGAVSPLSTLRSSHVSSIAFDDKDRLWVGYFDQGIDIFDPISMQVITHLEDENIREINFILLDKNTSKMVVATSAGLAFFDSQLQYKNLTERDGLNSNSVAHMSFIKSENTNELETAIATGKGLTLLKNGVFRSPISLPNNYLYSTALINNHLFVGSLGGLIEMEGLKVIRSFTISNSKLSHNWINALLTVNGTLYIGTNGGGVDALSPTGDLINFSPEIGKFDVNPNAMYADDKYLYVGTLDSGVFLLNLKSKVWRNYKQTLPSLNVTSIFSDKENVYFATTNGIVRIVQRELFTDL